MKKKSIEQEGKDLGDWFREVRIPQLEAEHALQGSEAVLTLTSHERRELAALLTRVVTGETLKDWIELQRWIDILVPEGL